MSVTSIDAITALDAWQLGANELLASGGELTNLITTIHDPSFVSQAWFVERSPNIFNHRGDNLSDVVNTIFPIRIAERARSRNEFYTEYLMRHDRVHGWRRGRHAWGTYFERLIRFPPDGINQLERVIEKLCNWPIRNTTGLVFHLSSPAVDAPRTRGGPCWHYGELLWNADGTLDLVAIYRNHDFFNKVFGNFIGLGLLLKFICDQSDKRVGKLICHSVHAYHDSSAHLLRSISR